MQAILPTYPSNKVSMRNAPIILKVRAVIRRAVRSVVVAALSICVWCNGTVLTPDDTCCSRGSKTQKGGRAKPHLLAVSVRDQVIQKMVTKRLVCLERIISYWY